MSAKKKNESCEPKKRTLYTKPLTEQQMKKLDEWLDRHLWAPYKVDYSVFAYKGPDVNVVAYSSGKLVVQGKGTESFVQFVLEPEITGVVEMGYESVHHPEWFEAHAGIDESGKGDLFGPLVSACVVADGDAVKKWLDSGLKESKKVASDAAALEMARMVKSTKGVVAKVSYAGMEKYNCPIYKIRAQSQQAAGVDALRQAIKSALAERHVPWGMLDQFTKQPLVQRQLSRAWFRA